MSVHSGRHGPKPPNRMAGSIFQRHPSSDSNPPTVTRRRSHSMGSRGFISPRRSASSSIVPGRRWDVAVRRRWSSHPASLVGHHLRPFVFGDVGHPPCPRDAVQVDEVGEPERLRVGELRHQRPALGVADDGHRPTRRHVIEDRQARRACRRPTSTARRGRCRRGRGASQLTTRHPAAANFGANTSYVRAKSIPPCTSSSGGASSSPHSWTAMPTPFGCSCVLTGRSLGAWIVELEAC